MQHWPLTDWSSLSTNFLNGCNCCSLCTLNCLLLVLNLHACHMLRACSNHFLMFCYLNARTRKLHKTFLLYLFRNVGVRMLISDYWIAFLQAWRVSMTVAAVQSVFCKTGIFSVNKNVIKFFELGPSAATDNLANLQGNNTQSKNEFRNTYFDCCINMLKDVGPTRRG